MIIIIFLWQEKNAKEETEGKSKYVAPEKVKDEKEIQEKGQEKVKREPSWTWKQKKIPAS